MTKGQQEQAITKAIKAGVRLTDEQVAFAGKNGICLWGSVNYEEHEQAVRNTPEAQRIARMGSVVDKFDVAAYQKAIYGGGWNR